MKLKGMEKLREKLPDYSGRKILQIPLKALIIAILAYLFLIGLDILPRIFSGISILVMVEPFLPIIGTLLVATIAIWLIGTVWSRKDNMKSEFGDRAYQMMIPKGLTGIAMIIPIIFHAFTSIRSLPPLPPVNDLTTFLANPLLQFVGVTMDLDVGLRLVLSGIFLVLGMLVVRSSFLTFGIDYMTVVYLYYPEESEIQEHEIYSVVRHPTYMGALFLGAAGMFFRFTFYSILFFVIFYLLFRIQIRREEIELITRFGDGYREYKERVPTIHVRSRDLRKFFKFLRPSS